MFGFATIPWIYKLESPYALDIRHHLPDGWSQHYDFYDKKGKLRLVIDCDGILRIPAGYSWDGCSYKLFKILDIWIVGTPDGAPKVRDGRPKTYYASLVHDVLYQFLDVNPDVPKAKADDIFLELMLSEGFLWSYLYYFVVARAGGPAHAIARRLRKLKSRRDPP